jgi:hypothetical protein
MQGKTRTDANPAGQHWQILRITFTGLPNGPTAAIADVKIDGKHRP